MLNKGKLQKSLSILSVAGVVLTIVFLFIIFGFLWKSGDTADKVVFNKTIAYVFTTVIAFFLLMGYLLLVEKKEIVFICLFISVFLVNLGYSFGSASVTLEEAILANKIAYVGSVFLPLLMLIIITDECQYRRNKYVLSCLLMISCFIFVLTMTPGYTDWYYKSVELAFVDGGAKLIKVYGDLHVLYFYYLITYFSLMLTFILWAMVEKRRVSFVISLSLLFLVLGNIIVWFIEQRINLGFEFLSISYLVTELCLLMIYLVNNNKTAKLLLNDEINDVSIEEKGMSRLIEDKSLQHQTPDIEAIVEIWPEVSTLTTRELEVFKEIVLNKKRKDIAENLCVSENTVKKHTSNIFMKLGVSNRSEIMSRLYMRNSTSNKSL